MCKQRPTEKIIKLCVEFLETNENEVCNGANYSPVSTGVRKGHFFMIKGPIKHHLVIIITTPTIFFHLSNSVKVEPIQAAKVEKRRGTLWAGCQSVKGLTGRDG